MYTPSPYLYNFVIRLPSETKTPIVLRRGQSKIRYFVPDPGLGDF